MSDGGTKNPPHFYLTTGKFKGLGKGESKGIEPESKKAAGPGPAAFFDATRGGL